MVWCSWRMAKFGFVYFISVFYIISCSHFSNSMPWYRLPSSNRHFTFSSITIYVYNCFGRPSIILFSLSWNLVLLKRQFFNSWIFLDFIPFVLCFVIREKKKVCVVGVKQKKKEKRFVVMGSSADLLLCCATPTYTECLFMSAIPLLWLGRAFSFPTPSTLVHMGIVGKRSNKRSIPVRCDA